jgi:hypothetical protein|tara:strand:+ start:877 stop:1074 length:198 start_codon:yes stop_codon:yes gene_type:complete
MDPKELIINVIKQKYLNDVDFFIDIIKEGTDNWLSMVDTLQELGNHLLENDEIDDFHRFHDKTEV